MDTAIDAGEQSPVKETVASALAAESPTAIETTEPEKTDPPTLDDTLEAAYEKITNPTPRGPDGKFAPRDPDAAAKEQPLEAKAEGEAKSADQTEEIKTEPAKPAIDPPISWPADMKAKFGALPPEMQTYVAQRDKENHEAISRLGNERKSYEDKVKSYEPLDQLIQSHKDEFARRGVTPPQAFAVLLDAQHKLDANPWDGLVQIARTYNIDLPSLIQGQTGQFQQPREQAPINPEVIALRAELGQIKSYLTGQQKRELASQEARQKAEQAATEKTLATLESQISEFSKDKPHFQSVEDDVAALIPAIRAKYPADNQMDILAKAYEAATWANPTVRERILADQRKAEEDKRREEAVKKATDAKKSAAVNVKSGSAGKTNPRNWTDTIEETATRLYGT